MTTKDRLIQSTQALLWEIGYTAMSPKDIQQRAGAGQGSMYHHFPGKADLAAAAIERSAAAFREGAEAVLSRKGSPLERIRGYMLRTRDALKGCQIGKLCQDHEIAHDIRLRRPLDTTFQWLQERLKGLIEEAKADGELPPDLHAGNAAAMLIAVIQGGYVLAAAHNSAAIFDRAISGALQFIDHSAGQGSGERPKRKRGGAL
jgi:TetR/AcrR family transcriptional regulator, transcriptional repressor for nem operon